MKYTEFSSKTKNMICKFAAIIPTPIFLKMFYRIKTHRRLHLKDPKTFSEKMGHSKNYRLSEALSIADIDFEDGAHDALVDAHNTALLFAKMEQEPVLRLSPYYITSAEDKPLTFTPFAELLSKYTFK